MRSLGAFATTVALLWWASGARAQELDSLPASGPERGAEPPHPAVARLPAPPTERVWYGHQTLIADGLVLTTAVVAASTKAPALGLLSFGTYVLGAPLVHIAHGHSERGMADVALRLGGPFVLFVGAASVTFLVTAPLSSSNASGTGPHNNFLAIGAGITAAFAALVSIPIADAHYLAYDDAESPGPRGGASKDASRTCPRWTCTLRPWVVPASGGGFAGVGAAF